MLWIILGHTVNFFEFLGTDEPIALVYAQTLGAWPFQAAPNPNPTRTLTLTLTLPEPYPNSDPNPNPAQTLTLTRWPSPTS